jgi:hypothetical protein
MKEVTLSLPDRAYEKLMAEASLVQQSPEQWITEKLLAPSGAQSAQAVQAELPPLLSAALDVLGFQRLSPEKAERLSTLLNLRKERSLLKTETDELTALLTEADTLELESLQRLTAALER